MNSIGLIEFNKQIVRVYINMYLLCRALKQGDHEKYGHHLNRATIELDNLRMMGCPSRASQVRVES